MINAVVFGYEKNVIEVPDIIRLADIKSPSKNLKIEH
jgi:hypothetical protein